MSARLHLWLSIAGRVVCTFVLSVLALFLGASMEVGQVGLVMLAVGGFIAGSIVARYLFTHLLAARCTCGGRMSLLKTNPIAYRCIACQQVFATRVYRGIRGSDE